jgi:acyloxyacyl hydrolase
MRGFIRLTVAVVVILAAFSPSVDADFSPAYVCSFCAMVLGLVEESVFQVHLESYLLPKCEEHKGCEFAVKELTKGLEGKMNPDDICHGMGVCPSQCTLYNVSGWPVPLPEQPVSWPTERRQLSLRERVTTRLDLPNLPLLRNVFLKVTEELGLPKQFDDSLPLLTHTTLAVGAFLKKLRSQDGNVEDGHDICNYNVSCHIEALINHMPLQDGDSDLFASEKVKTMRGSDWRGVDCDDTRSDVYPGRAVNNYDETVDHDCNGISGKNETGTYEDIFCKDYPGMGLIMLGDSATAHFHIPPQWITAQGWNLDGLLGSLENEIDYPMCSWGTGHVELEKCPYQYTDTLSSYEIYGVYSLANQLRQRNRCNHGDYQNIGVNGARITSSAQLVDAMARNQKMDKPAMVWLSLIGNDVCNGHPGFDHMTTPDDFYTHAMETLNRLDAALPPGSTVVSLALFEGELLYNTMYNKQHPVGSKYVDLYEFMNCLEENPCWGWLNANETNRRITTQRSDQLNNVYRNISHTIKFENINYVFYAPLWSEMFVDYQQKGFELSNLIEAVDGFHPSQTGNALLAWGFWDFLVTKHPEAIGAENPHNAEIDALFFNNVASK